MHDLHENEMMSTVSVSSVATLAASDDFPDRYTPDWPENRETRVRKSGNAKRDEYMKCYRMEAIPRSDNLVFGRT